MAHSQRQKKRSSQFRKKHFEAKGRALGEGGAKEERHASGSPEKASLQQAGAEVNARVPNPDQSEEKTESLREVQSEDVRKYSRRKLASNWDRYDPEAEAATFSPETEEQLQLRLVQLLSLPQVPQHTQQAIQEVEERGEGEGEGFLSLDVAELAKSLRSLPVSERLDLPAELLELYGVRESELVADSGAKRAPSPSPPLAEVETRSLLSRARETSTQSFDFSAPREKTTVGQPSLETEAPSDVDLDSLLLSSQPPGPADPLPPPPSSLHPESDHTPHTRKATPPNLAGTKPLPTTTELDDMLDDLLS